MSAEAAVAIADAAETIAGTIPFTIEGLLEGFQPPPATAKKKASHRAEKHEEHLSFAGALQKLPPFTEVVIIGGKVNERSNPLLKELAALTKIKNFPAPTGNNLTRWITERVAGAGGAISAPAAQLLARFIGSDLWKMSGEVDKLLLYAAGRRIEEKDVREGASSSEE